jgi:pimeloyl-ACP methyl ester carboxylesterase
MQKQVLPWSLRMSGFLMSALGKPFPGLTARIFLRFYSTPPKRKFRPAQLLVKDSAVNGTVSYTQYPFNSELLTLATYKWGNGGKKVLLVHGWGGSPLDFKYMINALVEKGYEVLAFDMPAHGFSRGKRTNLVQWMHMLEQFITTHKDLYAVIGHSLGGLSAALALAMKQISVPKLVMIGSAVSTPAIFEDTFHQFNINSAVMPIVQQLIAQKLQSDIRQMDLHKHIGKIKAKEILVVYDENDVLARHQDITSFVEAYNNVQSFKIVGDGHFKIIKDPQVLNRILAFLQASVS